MTTTQKKRKSRKLRRNKKQIGGDIDTFYAKLTRQDDTLVMIGKGGAGTVYYDSTQPTVVFKVSNRAEVCREWRKEEQIYEQLNRYSIDTPHVKVLRLNRFKVFGGNTGCILELSRVVNPIDSAADYTIQVQLGVNSLTYKNRARGLFLGVQQLIEKGIIPEAELNEYVKELAHCMARLHYEIKNDGFDIEIFAGKEDGRTVLYIGDFDLSNMIKSYDKQAIDSMSWCFGAVPYFPVKEQGELYSVFKDSYLTTAESLGYKEVAEKVLFDYEN